MRIKRVSRLLTNARLAKIRAENEAEKAEAAVEAARKAAPEAAAVVEAPDAVPAEAGHGLVSIGKKLAVGIEHLSVSVRMGMSGWVQKIDNVTEQTQMNFTMSNGVETCWIPSCTLVQVGRPMKDLKLWDKMRHALKEGLYLSVRSVQPVAKPIEDRGDVSMALWGLFVITHGVTFMSEVSALTKNQHIRK